MTIIHKQEKPDREWVVFYKLEDLEAVEVLVYIEGRLTSVKAKIELDDDRFYVYFGIPRTGRINLKECKDA